MLLIDISSRLMILSKNVWWPSVASLALIAFAFLVEDV
uniref:Uncharacterized protein n=1 Tax=Rhizophora mucronata TaxID=61149 RepID=A0A2P2QF01_RHIMU